MDKLKQTIGKYEEAQSLCREEGATNLGGLSRLPKFNVVPRQNISPGTPGIRKFQLGTRLRGQCGS